MKALVVYDSVFGNTEKVALEVAKILGQGSDVRVLRVSAVSRLTLEGVKLLVVGSPTRAFRPTDGIRRFLRSLQPESLSGIKAAAFDTRADISSIASPIVRTLVKRGGFAAPTIAKRLRRCGAEVVEPAGFIVEDTEGPLKEGELQNAAEWARSIA